MADKTPPLILIDGSSYLFRAFHALPPLTNSKGQPTGAIKGVVNMLRRMEKDYPNSPVAAVFDAKGKTFRNDMYSEYKAHRPPMPDDLRSQIEPLHNIIRAMGIPLLIIDGVEADDVIGTLTSQAIEHGLEVVVSTGDKDMAQLVNSHVTLVNTMTDTTMDIAGVEAKFGIPPELIIDYLALMGDKVDNIPGVAGVGEKTALALLQGLGGLDDIYNNLEKIKELSFRGAKTMAQKLEEHKENAYLSYQLATIKTDVDLDITLGDLKPEPEDHQKLLELFTDLEFKSWIREQENIIANPQLAETQNNNESETSAANYHVVFEESELDEWLKKLSAADIFAFDTETTSLNYMEAQIVGVSFAINAGEAVYVPCSHDYVGAPEQISRDVLLTKLKPLLENPALKKVGQNLKYDRSVLLNHDIDLQGIEFDTMLESYVLNSVATRHDMDSLAEFYLGKQTIHFEDIAGKGAKQLTFNQIEIEKAGPYAAEDADITLQLHQKLSQELSDEKSLESVLKNIEMPLLPVLSKIERTGALIDTDLLQKHSQELEVRLKTLEKDAYDMAGEEFNLASPKQLGTILFEKLNIPAIKKTKTGTPSTAEDVLQELALDYPLPKLLLEYRGLAKLKSTYTDKLPLMRNEKTGRVHTSYHQAVTATGRLSSSDPNLQNIPIRNAEGRRIRQAFIAPENYKILAADYSQIELRIMAHLSGDKGLLHAFQNDLDVHKATAAEVFSTSVDAVTNDQRRSAKAINFGLIYGMSAFGLAKQLNIGRNDAQGYIDRYFEKYPGVAEYMDEIRASAKERGYVETIMGRRLYLPEINSTNGMRRQAAERTAINAPMQGSAADIIKKAMILVDGWLQDSATDARIIMQVHDELVLEVAESQLEFVQEKVCAIMSSATELSVPLLVEAGFGNNWDEAH
ncbi:DNA polymerase I [Sessilibacter sp. MAH1]